MTDCRDLFALTPATPAIAARFGVGVGDLVGVDLGDDAPCKRQIAIPSRDASGNTILRACECIGGDGLVRPTQDLEPTRLTQDLPAGGGRAGDVVWVAEFPTTTCQTGNNVGTFVIVVRLPRFIDLGLPSSGSSEWEFQFFGLRFVIPHALFRKNPGDLLWCQTNNSKVMVAGCTFSGSYSFAISFLPYFGFLNLRLDVKPEHATPGLHHVDVYLKNSAGTTLALFNTGPSLYTNSSGFCVISPSDLGLFPVTFFGSWGVNVGSQAEEPLIGESVPLSVSTNPAGGHVGTIDLVPLFRDGFQVPALGGELNASPVITVRGVPSYAPVGDGLRYSRLGRVTSQGVFQPATNCQCVSA